MTSWNLNHMWRNLVIRTHVSWYPQFLLALLRLRLTCNMITTSKRECIIRGKYACAGALTFTMPIKEKFHSTLKESICSLGDICHNEFSASDCPTNQIADTEIPTKSCKLYSKAYCLTMNSSHRPPWSLINPSVSVCFRAKDDLPSSIPGRHSWDSQCRRVLLLLCKSLFEILCPDQD